MIKSAIYVIATLIGLRTLAPEYSMMFVGLSILGACFLASKIYNLMLGWIILLGCAFSVTGILIENTILALPFGLDAKESLALADIAFWTFGVFGVVFILRALGNKHDVLSVFEVIFVTASVAYSFSVHRNKQIHQPRVLSDWAWSHGIDPEIILQVLGVVVVLCAGIVLLKTRRLAKIITTFATLLFLIILLINIGSQRLEPIVDTGGLGLTKQEQEESNKKKEQSGRNDGRGGKGGSSGGSGGGQSQKGRTGGGSGGASSGAKSSITVPVAIAILHDDYTPLYGIYYFRQNVFSRFDGNHLVADEIFDTDVITSFPVDTPIMAAPTLYSENFRTIPTSMFLLVDHPQPVALTSSIKISPLENPNPRHFVASYEVESLTLTTDYSRLSGRPSIPNEWTEEMKSHYLTIPNDPRYKTLAEEIVRDIDPRFRGDPMLSALKIKQYLEKKGFYTRSVKYEDPVDPTGVFLFGNMRGYCVHFAHAAVYLMRALGIAARVAVGYAVEDMGQGSTIMILSHQAHAWPEIHIANVGWVPLDIYPEQTDEPPPILVDQDLETLLGELARRDPTGGRAESPRRLEIPWEKIGWAVFAVIIGLFWLSYMIKFIRQLYGKLCKGKMAYKVVFRAVLDRLSDMGFVRYNGETRESFAMRMAETCPSLVPLTYMHLRCALGNRESVSPVVFRKLHREASKEIRQKIKLWRRIAGWINPIGWFFTR